MVKFVLHLVIALVFGWIFSNHWAHAQYNTTHKRVKQDYKIKVILAIAVISVFCAMCLCKPATYGVLLIIVCILQIVSYNRVRMWNTLTVLFTGYMVYSIAMRWDALGKPEFKLLFWLIPVVLAILVATYKTVVDRFFVPGFARDKNSAKESCEARRKTKPSESGSDSTTKKSDDVDDDYDDDDDEFDDCEDPITMHMVRWVAIGILAAALIALIVLLF